MTDKPNLGLPWQLAPSSDVLVIDSDNREVADCELHDYGKNFAEYEAKAAFIVKTANCHDELVAALNAMLTHYRSEGCADPTCGVCQRSKAAQDLANKAIARAGGGAVVKCTDPRGHSYQTKRERYGDDADGNRGIWQTYQECRFCHEEPDAEDEE